MNMKKIFFIIAVQIFVVKFAFAQRGLHGNSDWKVPVPVISPQMDPSLSVNQIAVPNIPAIPSVTYPVGPTIAPRNLVPPVPNTPLVPPLPTSAVAAGPVLGELKMKVPRQQILPPLPPIPTSPTVKMPSN